VNISQWINRVAAELESAELFYGHGTDNPGDEAAWLVLHAAGVKPDGSFADWGRALTPEQETRVLQTLSARIGSREPLAYLLGTAWFAGMEFEIDRSVLVPRSPIAELILDEFVPWLKNSSGRQALDMCTGCGCIGIAMAAHMPGLKVDAADISPEALAVARRNVRRHRVESRVRLFLSDLYNAMPPQTYDLIVANPPYVPASALQDLPGEYHAEPRLGLVSGADGLDACLQIMLQSPAYMCSDASLVCEVGESESLLAEKLPGVPFMWLEFSHGGSGVFVLSRQELVKSSAAIMKVLEERAHVG